MSTSQKLLLIDGNALMYRAFFSLNYNKFLYYKTPINAVYGFIDRLIDVIFKAQPSYICVAFDTPKKSFRYLVNNNYKAQRPPMPQELASQFAILYELLSSLNIQYINSDILKHNKVLEGDDIIGIISYLAHQNNITTEILTLDKDMFQLINNNISILYMHNKNRYEIIDEDVFNIQYGFKVEAYIEYLALKGDRSDNIAGIKGVGEVRAKRLIQEYGTIKNILNNISLLKPKHIQQEILNSQDIITENIKLLNIIRNIDNLDIHIDLLRIKHPSYDNFYDICQNYNLNNLGTKINYLYNILKI